jgi:hypothetical protein
MPSVVHAGHCPSWARTRTLLIQRGRGEPPNSSNLHAFTRVRVTRCSRWMDFMPPLLCFTHSDVTVWCLLSATSNPKADLRMGKQRRVDEASLGVHG